MATQANDEAFLQKYGNYKPAPANVPVTAIKPILAPTEKPEKPDKPTETFRMATEAEKTGAGLDPKRSYQINNVTGEFKDVSGQAPAKPSLAADPNRAFKINSTLDQLANLRALSEKSLSVGEQAGRVRETPLIGALFGQNRADLEGALSQVEGSLIQDQLAALAQINPGGVASLANSETEARRLASSIANLDPNQSRDQFLSGIARAEEYYKRQLEQLGGKREPATPAAPGPTVAPIEAGKDYQTEQDLAAQSALQAAWNRGASVDEIIQINSQFGRDPLSPADIEWLRANPGKPRSFYATPSGQPTAAQGIIGAALSTPVGEAVGGYTLGAANALTAGTLDELAPILGLDPARVQAAKDYLRERAPTASLAGEVTGGILGSIPAVRGSTALLGGTRLAGAAPLIGEIAYGAGYGAGEAPEGQRALGALIGGGAAGVGGALANRFLPGGPGTFTGMAPEVPAGAVMPEVPPVAAMTPEVPPVAGQVIAEPPVGAPLPSAGGAIELTADDIARFTTPEDRAIFNQRQLEYIARNKKFLDQQAAQAAPTPTPTPEASPVAAAPTAAAPIPTPEAAAELGTIIREASGTGAKAKGAQTKLAEMAQVNPEAKAAAERLGIDVPADVFSDNPQVRAAIGLTRSLAGGEAEAAWRTAVSNAVDQADNIMRDFDAQFVEGAVAPGVVSQRVKDSLTKTRADLNAEASAIYKRVDESVPKQTPVQMDNLFRELTAIAGEVGESGMTAQEKRLIGLIQSGEVGDGDITYGRLIREKNLIGKALKREESPYGSLDEATLKRLYGALATDQLDNVGRIGGEELRAELRGANLIYAKERALGERIINAFGRDLEGGIANRMRAAITGAAKGDPGDFARLMKAVPADLRKEVVATALTAAARSARGAEKGGFGFSEFADLYPKLRANPQVYKQIVETLGPKASDTLRDLFEVSKRITDARANVLTTGKANQALVESLNAEGILARIMDSTTAKRAVGAMAGLGGPVTGAVMPDIMQAMSKGNPDAVRAAGKMFVSPEFQSLLTEAATQPEVTERAINRAVSSQRFRDFAKTIGLELKQGRNWLRSAITAGSVQEMGPEAGPPEGAIIVMPQQ